METPPPIYPGPTDAHHKPKPKLFKTLLIILGVVAYTAAVAYISIIGYRELKAHNDSVQQSKINPHVVVQQGLVNLLDTKSVTRHITYRDNLDKSMLVTWDIDSDFSNTRDPKSHGILTIDYLLGTAHLTQKLEFYAVKATRYQNNLYFRMTEGNAITNAPKNWFLLGSSDIISFERKDLFQRDANINLFGLNAKATGFEKFKGFNFFLYNNPAFYFVIGDMRDSPEKAKIISEITNDKAYVLQDCAKDRTSSWCSGSFNTGGLASITSNYASSEGEGSEPGLKFDSTQFWLTANNQTKNIDKFEVGSNDSDKFVVTYSKYNQPVSITLPAAYIK